METCASCATQLQPGARFCFSCGAPTATGCVSCGSELPAGARFCPTCGSAQTDGAPASGTPVATRRITSVLFGDLVGFTSLSEQRDQEDVRDLLSAYFEECRRIVDRYGGTVEKFVGDAVMAVWGVPTAHEDDAERAVRAGLELVNRVAAMGAELGAPDLAMRVGIVTGEVAVTIGATQQGMVAGDAVNTAARVQTAAAPGQVWVDETTRLLTTAAISYVDVGAHAMKGKADPMPLWAVRAVVAALGGAQRADGLEAPLVGRLRELRLVKELFHGAEESGNPALLVVEGEAGVGKTRLGWEFEKYADGLQTTVRWHSGRCLSYGEGVAYFALAEAIRGRLQLLRPDGVETTVGDEDLPMLIDLGLDEYVLDAGEREWLGPRLGALLGVGAIAEYPREDLFAAWATFLHRVGADDGAVVLVIDDAQHADEGLLGFLEYLLGGGAGAFGCLVVLLARPGLLAANPALATHRRASVLHLDTLADKDMAALLDGLVDGLPDRVRDALVLRAEGIPLYAVETLRSLVDRDLVVPRGGRYVLAQQDVDIDSIGSPASLQALIAARLDALPADERRLLDNASVLGRSFQRDLIAQLCPDIVDLDAVLASLVRMQLLEQESNRFSSEVGLYQFVQGVVRQVAYGTIARRDRKARHLAVATLLEGDDEAGTSFSAVVAQHYLEALDAIPDAPDADQLARAAVRHLERAAERATAIGAPKEAVGHLEQAVARCADPHRAAVLEIELARQLLTTQQLDAAYRRSSHAMEVLDDLGDQVHAAQAAAGAAAGLTNALGETEAALRLIDERLAAVERLDGSEVAVKRLLESKVTTLIRRGEPADDAAEALLRMVEQTDSPGYELLDAYVGLAIHYAVIGPQALSLLLFEAAASGARENRDPLRLARALANLCGQSLSDDLARSARFGAEAVDAARTAGSKRWLDLALSNHNTVQLFAGDWDDLLASSVGEEPSEDEPLEAMRNVVRSLVAIARDQPVAEPSGSSANRDAQLVIDLGTAVVASAVGDRDRVALLVGPAVRDQIGLSRLVQDVCLVLHVALESLVQVRASEAMAEVVALVEAERTWMPVAVRSVLRRLLAHLAADRGEDEAAAELWRASIEDALAWGSPVLAARGQGELAVCLLRLGRDDDAATYLASARATYERLGAAGWLRELAAALPAHGVMA
jgi:class 3 adenylate cyclase